MKKQEKLEKCRIIPTCAAWSEWRQTREINSTVLILVPSATCFKLSEALGTRMMGYELPFTHANSLYLWEGLWEAAAKGY